MLSSSQSLKWSRMWRGIGAVCGAVLVLGLVWALLLTPQRVAVGDPHAPEDATGLQVDKVGPDTTQVEEVFTYTLFVTNNTALPLNDVIITDTWNSQIYSGTYTSGGAVVVNSLVLVTQPVKYAQFNLATLPANSNGFIQITMVVTGGLQPRYTVLPIVLGNSAVITTSTPGVIANTDSVNTMIVGPILVITKTVTPTLARPGQLFTYTLQVYNRYRTDAIDGTNVVITERLPNNVLFNEALPADIATFFPETRTVQWFVPTLPVSTSVFVTITARVTPTAAYGNIQNNKVNCGVKADGVPLGIICSTDVNLQVDDVFEKVGLTISPPQQTGTISRTFPNRIMTYTVSVYNPFTETVDGMLVTDTLPTYNNVPTQTFYYSGLLAWGAPGMPTVVAQTSRIVAWQLPALQPGSVYTFSFQAFVPPQMRIDDNQALREYANRLSGGYTGTVLATNDGSHDDSMKTRVVRQIELIKLVTPTEQMYGWPVTYTLIVSNAGPTTVSDIQLTDILPTRSGSTSWCGFQWDGLVSGQPPNSAIGNQVSWSGITLTGYSQITLATFRAIVYGYLNTSCPNTVQGYSPDTYIVRRTDLAPVTVLVPFRYTKMVNPASVVLGGQIQYTVQEFNIGTIPAHMTEFEDVLPTGFKYNGNPVYSETVDLTLEPNGASKYQTTFPVDVLEAPVPCDSLPKTIYQARGSFGMWIDSPPELSGGWVNASDAAGVMVYPQATANKVFDPPGALPGGVITFTIMLTNNTSLDIPSVRITDTLPNGFVFGSSLPGTPDPFAIIPPNVFWSGVTIPANGRLTLAFTAIATTTVGNYQNIVKAASLIDPSICIPRYMTSAFPVKLGQVELNKQVTPKSVSPFGQFQYNITLRNTGPYTVTISRFTETLPGVPGYPWKYISMQSGDPLPVSTEPLAWANLTLGSNQNLSLRVNVRTSYQVGTYPNLAPPDPQANLAGYMSGTLPAGWVFTQTSNYDNAPLTVIPGVGMSKDVYPSAITLPLQSTVIYTITVVNVSASTANNVRITDTLPAGFTYDAWIAGDLPLFTNPPVWTFSTLPAGTVKQLVFRARITAQQPSGTYYNQLALTADGLYFPPMSNLAPVTVKGIPSLVLSKDVSPNAVIAGRSVTYTLTLQNPDLSDSVTARVTDTLPSGFTFAEMISGPTPLATSPQVVWALDVPSSTTQILSFRALVSVNTLDGTYYNQLNGSSSQIVFPGTGPTAPVAVTQPLYDVQVSKSDGAYTATIGGGTIYTIYYTNALNSLNLTAGGVVLTETLAPSDYLIADAPGWNLVSPGVYTYFVGDLPAGATGQITFGVLIDNGIPIGYSTITNTVAIGSAGAVEIPEAIERPTANNIAVDVDLIRGGSVTLGPDQSGSVCAGSQIVYTLTVSNNTAFTDTINLTLQPAAPVWTTLVQPSALVLSAFGSGLVRVTVTVPSSATPGSTDSVTVTATGQTSGLLGRASIQTMAKSDITCVTCVSPSTTFTYTPVAPRVNQTITFTAVATGTSPFTYTWSFDDGSAAAVGNPIGHSYAIAGTFHPTLTVTNQCGSAVYSTAVIVAANTTTTTLTSSPNPSVLSQTVTFTATVVPVAATGVVRFYADGTLLAGPVTVSNGMAQAGTAALSVGTHVITATYSGDASYLTSSSTPLNQVVMPATTTTTLTSSPNPSLLGQTVTFTATVVPAAATGVVWLYADGTLLTGAVAVSNGIAQVGTAALSVGTHIITATYSGNASYLASTSVPLSQVVLPTTTCLPITSVSFNFVPSIPTTGQPVNFTAAITGGTPPITYTWNFGHGADVVTPATSIVHTFPSTYILQTYLVTLAAANGCSNQTATAKWVNVQPLRVHLPVILK